MAASSGVIKQDTQYTVSDIEALPEGIRAELIGGQLFYMASPSSLHQEIEGEVFAEIRNYIKSHNGKCKVYTAPYAVYLFGMDDDHDYYEPDITVVCNPEKRKEKGCDGAPDWIIEIVSPSTASRDYLYKLNRYREAGVREYWIVNPDEKGVNVFDFSDERNASKYYSFSDRVPSVVINGFTICIGELITDNI
ncbi:MAG: Uma2 family endonuclease [Blautia sp.]|nr:Uma2 family endonuclease [Blautia sp.]